MSNSFVAFVVGLILGAECLVLVSTSFKEQTMLYKDGQIDALNGKILYELKKQEDGSVQWRKIEK